MRAGQTGVYTNLVEAYRGWVGGVCKRRWEGVGAKGTRTMWPGQAGVGRLVGETWRLRQGENCSKGEKGNGWRSFGEGVASCYSVDYYSKGISSKNGWAPLLTSNTSLSS